MLELNDVRQGWEFMAEVLGADQAATGIKNLMQEQNDVQIFNANANQENINIDHINEHINEINKAIDRLADRINNHPHVGNTLEHLKDMLQKNGMLKHLILMRLEMILQTEHGHYRVMPMLRWI